MNRTLWEKIQEIGVIEIQREKKELEELNRDLFNSHNVLSDLT